MEVELIVNEISGISTCKEEGVTRFKITADADMHLLLNGDQNFLYLKGVIDSAFKIYKEEYIPESRDFRHGVKPQYSSVKINYMYIEGFIDMPFKGDNLQPPDGNEDVYFEGSKTFEFGTKIEEVIQFTKNLCEEISELPEPQLIEFEPFEE